jgi:hypothetical protein
LLIFALWPCALFGMVWALVRHAARRQLRERLVELGVPICIHCGYDLRGQTVPRCPECGRGFDPALLQPEGEEKQPES